MQEEERVPPVAEEGRARRLAAILHADVQGYSRLIERDEVATLRILTPSLQRMTDLVRQHGGHPIGSRGDSLLAEFPSVRSAVQCAVEMQQELQGRTAELPAEQRIAFRMGIHVGEVIEDGEQLHGDGINIAVRLESLAEPGGILISGTVYDQVKNKLPLQYEALGEQQLKNIAEQVRVYRVVLEGQRVTASKRGKRFLSLHPGKRAWMQTIGAGITLLLLVGGIGTLWYRSASPPHAPQSTTPQPADKPLPLPDKPSIVVLPFTNMSGDPEQEYFSDGLTEDLITNLSKFSGLFVIARNSAFTYKGKAVKVQDVSREMGVRYILEGSVRKADSQVRITAQLVDAVKGAHLWAESYDRELQDIFALQDEIRQQVVTALQLKVSEAEIARAKRTPTHNLTAYDYFLRGVEYHNRFTKEAHDQARRLYEQALAVDPQYAEAYMVLGWSYYFEWAYQWSEDPQVIERAAALAQQAITLDRSLAYAHTLVGVIYLWRDHQYERAITEGKLALSIDPNCGACAAWYGQILSYAGRPQEAIGLIEKAMRLDPCCTDAFAYFLAEAYILMEQYEQTIAPAKRALIPSPDSLGPHLILVTSYSALGQDEQARAEAAEILRINPNFSLEAWRQSVPIKDPAQLERYLVAMRKAGLK